MSVNLKLKNPLIYNLNYKVNVNLNVKRKVLLIGDAVSFSHYFRPFILSQWIDRNEFEVHFASEEKYLSLILPGDVFTYSFPSLLRKNFIQILEKGKPLFSKEILKEQQVQDKALIAKIKPDLIIGDFRLSLALSSKEKKIPYWNLSNAYWSPNILLNFPIPEFEMFRTFHNFFQFLPDGLLNFFYKQGFKTHLQPILKELQRHELFFKDIREFYTQGDLVLYCDHPDFIPLKSYKNHELFLGPLFGFLNDSNQISKQKKLKLLSSTEETKKTVYITMGSSGPTEKLEFLIKEFDSMNYQLIVQDIQMRKFSSKNIIYSSQYIEGEWACQLCDLVVCNGGSGTVYQALKYGKPVLGIVSNTDQVLMMSHAEYHQVGIMIRFWQLEKMSFQEEVYNFLKQFSDNRNKLFIWKNKIEQIDSRFKVQSMMMDLK